MFRAMPTRRSTAHLGLDPSQTALTTPMVPMVPMIGRQTFPSMLTPLAKLLPVIVKPLPICTLRMTVAWQAWH